MGWLERAIWRAIRRVHAQEAARQRAIARAQLRAARDALRAELRRQQHLRRAWARGLGSVSRTLQRSFHRLSTIFQAPQPTDRRWQRRAARAMVDAASRWRSAYGTVRTLQPPESHRRVHDQLVAAVTELNVLAERILADAQSGTIRFDDDIVKRLQRIAERFEKVARAAGVAER